MNPPSDTGGDTPPVPCFDRDILSDDFLGWLRFVNAGMLEDGNIVAMNHAVKHMPAGAVIEIGSFCGLSMNVLTHLRRRHGRNDPLFSCDPWLFEGADTAGAPMGDGGVTFGEYRDLVRDSFLRNVRAFSRNDMPHAIEATSDEFFDAWNSGIALKDVFDRQARPGGAVGFAYIDGDHQYEQAQKDFKNIDAALAPGGFILFDDSADGSGWEVCRVVAEIRDNRPDYELVGQFPNYLFQKKNR